MNSLAKVLGRRGMAAVVCFLLSGFLQIVAQNQIPRKEIRAVWLTTNWQLDWPSRAGIDELTAQRQKAELCRMLDRFADANMNVVFFQGRLRGEVLYNSRIEPWSRFVSGKNGLAPAFDPLEFAISECHKRGLECHVWMVTMPLGGSPAIFNEKWTAIASNPGWYAKHGGEYYLDPGQPQVKAYLASLVEEVTRNYDVDGIHLDYIRYPENAETFNDDKTYKAYGGNLGLYEWRRNNITEIVYGIYDRVKSIKPWVKVSCAPIGRYRNIPGMTKTKWTARDAVFQDVERWFADGKMDFVAPMMYYKEDLFYPYVIDWVRVSNGRPIVPGLGYYRYDEKNANWNLQEIENQIFWSRRMGAKGHSVYRAKNMLSGLGSLSGDLYPEKMNSSASLLPPMSWMRSDRPEAPLFPTVRYSQASDEADFAWGRVDGVDYYTIYGAESREQFNKGNYSIIAPKIQSEADLVRVRLDKEHSLRFFVVTGSNRFNVESKGAVCYSEKDKMLQNFNTFDEFYYDNKIKALNLNDFNRYRYIEVKDMMGTTIWKGPVAGLTTKFKLSSGVYRLLLSDNNALVKDSFLLVR